MHESDNGISYELQQLSGWLYDGRGGYSLGYLLWKLPKTVVGGEQLRIEASEGANLNWCAEYGTLTYEFADTPEDALCKLAIELFKAGVLQKENPHETIISVDTALNLSTGTCLEEAMTNKSPSDHKSYWVDPEIAKLISDNIEELF